MPRETPSCDASARLDGSTAAGLEPPVTDRVAQPALQLTMQGLPAVRGPARRAAPGSNWSSILASNRTLAGDRCARDDRLTHRNERSAVTTGARRLMRRRRRPRWMPSSPCSRSSRPVRARHRRRAVRSRHPRRLRRRCLPHDARLTRRPEPPRGDAMTSWTDLEAAAPDLADDRPAPPDPVRDRRGPARDDPAGRAATDPPGLRGDRRRPAADVRPARLGEGDGPRGGPRYALHLHVDPAAPDEFLVRGRARRIDDPALVAARPRGLGVRRPRLSALRARHRARPAGRRARPPTTGRRSTRPGARPPAERGLERRRRPARHRPTRRRSPRPGSGPGWTRIRSPSGKPERAAPRPRRRRSGR